MTMKVETKSKNPYLPQKAIIKKIIQETADVKTFVVEAVNGKHDAFEYAPGQFAFWSFPGVGEAPFSYSNHTDEGKVEFTIHKIGKVTEQIFKLKEGDEVGIRGPYGNGFPMKKIEGKNIVFIMGGLGAAPLRGVLHYVLNNADKYGKICIYHGARSPKDMLFKDEFDKLTNHPAINCLLTVDTATPEDEWKYNIGVVTTLFNNYSKEELDPDNTVAMICGPPIMYKFVINELKKLNMPQENVYMTLERRMKCGVGKCGHCVIDYVYACVEGPVFNLWDAKYMKDMI